MSANEAILWVSSLAPDQAEKEVFLSLAGRLPRVCQSVPEAVEIMATEQIDLLFANFPSADGTAAELMASLPSSRGRGSVFVRDTQASVADAMRLAKLGLEQLIGRDVDVEDVVNRIDLCISDVRSQRKLEKPAAPRLPWQKSLVGESRAMEQVSQVVQLVAGRRCTVLISGETGTGKEVVARAKHAASPRSAAPFVAINCSALPESLLEAELFGHVKGAFTGAQQLRIGRFEMANHGTLFLDEIGDMPLDLQAKLLRVLQEREFQRLGSSETISVDVRIVAATNVDLRDRVRQGLFREDLYYRLNVVPVQMPALRSRAGDIPALVQYFIAKICREEALPVKTVRGEALRDLQTRRWPGNVRQLENAVEMAVVLSGTRSVLETNDFPTPEDGLTTATAVSTGISVPDHGLDFQLTVDRFERSILSQALRKTQGNKKQAAEMLGLKRTTLSAKVRLLETAAGCPLI